MTTQNKGAGLFTPSERAKLLPLPVLPPIPEVLCQSCSMLRGGPVPLTPACIERRHAKITRAEWERRDGGGLPSKAQSVEGLVLAKAQPTFARFRISTHRTYDRQ